MTLSVAELQPVLHDLFTDTADDLAREHGFCQRRRKLSGSAFAQSLVFTLLGRPDATLDDFAETAEECLGVPVSPQAFDQRFTPAAASFLRHLLLESFDRCFASIRPALLPVLRRFPAVFLRDATLVELPPCLADHFPGRGGRHAPGGKAAAAKLVLEVEVTTGQFTEASLLAGVDNERIAEVAGKPLPRGALLLEDMGFLSGERLQEYMLQGVYVLTRVPAWTALFVPGRRGKGFQRLDLVGWLRGVTGDGATRRVWVFHGEKLALRLLAVRVPPEEAEKRRRRVRQEAKQRGRPVSQKKLDLCEWNVLVTNAPADKVGLREGWVMRRVRWQIELVFKGYKSEGKVGECRSGKGARALCELFAKLLAMVVQQWALLAAGYRMLRHSVRRVARRVRAMAKRLLRGLGSLAELGAAVARLAKVLHERGRIAHGKAQPSTLDLLDQLDPEPELCRQLGWSLS